MTDTTGPQEGGRRNSAAGPDPRELIGAGAPVAGVPCGLVHDLMPAAVGGDLESETEAVLERHVGECLHCAREWRSLVESHYALRSLAEGGVADPGFDDAFFADLHRGIVGALRRQSAVQHDTRILRGRRRRAGGASWIPVAGALAATLVAGFFLGKAMDSYGAGGPPAVTAPGVRVAADARRLDWQLLADPGFTPYLVEAIRRFAERKASENPIADPGKALAAQGTDF